MEHAKLYHKMGFALLPVHYPIHHMNTVRCSCNKPDCKAIGKHPVARLVPNGVKDASKDWNCIERWFTGQVRFNLGIATGAASGIFAVDIDDRHGGQETLKTLELAFGVLPNTVRFLTGGGGEHILFRHPGTTVPNLIGKIGKGVDIKGDGGYIVAPPSHHASGRSYAINVDYHPDYEVIQNAPAWLLEKIFSKNNPKEKIATWRSLTRYGVAQGERNATITKLTGLLLGKRIDRLVCFDLMLGFNQLRCAPPLSDKEIAAIVVSIARREQIKKTTRQHEGKNHD
jgi:putative DNA primase/helicase